MFLFFAYFPSAYQFHYTFNGRARRSKEMARQREREERRKWFRVERNMDAITFTHVQQLSVLVFSCLSSFPRSSFVVSIPLFISRILFSFLFAARVCVWNNFVICRLTGDRQYEDRISDRLKGQWMRLFAVVDQIRFCLVSDFSIVFLVFLFLSVFVFFRLNGFVCRTTYVRSMPSCAYNVW